MAIIRITKPPGFHFWRTVYSHGWCTLLPYRVDRDTEQLIRILRLSNGSIVECIITDSPHALQISIGSKRPLTSQARSEIRSQVRACLRLDEDLSEFYSLARNLKRFRWVPRSGAGRLLRAPTVFEDIVKTICTTNCSWALTQSMVTNLVGELGSPFGNRSRAFPTPGQMAGVSEGFYRKNIRSGYRSPYLLKIAERVAAGKLEVESWRKSSLPTEELYREIRGVKGMGDYAAGNLMRLLGRYDSLALDSWVRSKYSELYHSGRRVSDRTIERAFQTYGPWRGLFFWLDMTREWLTEKFPF